MNLEARSQNVVMKKRRGVEQHHARYQCRSKFSVLYIFCTCDLNLTQLPYGRLLMSQTARLVKSVGF